MRPQSGRESRCNVAKERMSSNAWSVKIAGVYTAARRTSVYKVKETYDDGTEATIGAVKLTLAQLAPESVNRDGIVDAAAVGTVVQRVRAFNAEMRPRGMPIIILDGAQKRKDKSGYDALEALFRADLAADEATLEV